MTVTEYIEKTLKEDGIKFPKDMVDKLIHIISNAGSVSKSDYINASALLYKIYRDYKDQEE